MTEYEDLSIDAKLNIEADRMAKEYNCKQGKIQLDPDDNIVPSNTAALIIKGSMVTSRYYDRLVETYSEMRYMSYLQRRFVWHEETLQSIAWKSFTDAINNNLYVIV